MFHNRWFTGQKRKVITEALALAPPPSRGSVIEIGSWEGHSSVWLANHIHPQPLHCFDWWLGSSDPADETWHKAKQRDVYAEFLVNMAEKTQGNFKVWKGDWRKTLPLWPRTSPIRFVFIDATHTYDEVKDNIEALLPLLAPKAVLSGDDFYAFPGVGKAVMDTLGGTGRVVAPRTGHGAWYWTKDETADQQRR